MRFLLLCLSLALTASPLLAQEGPLGLSAPPVVADSGLLKYILPRFSLKTSIRVQPDPAGSLVLDTSPPGTPVFQGGDQIYYLRTGGTEREARFLDWLTSEIGKRTVDSFQSGGKQLFSSDVVVAKVEVEPTFDGNAEIGARLSQTHCGRCHVIDKKNRMNGLGSTPSFAVLRALPN